MTNLFIVSVATGYGGAERSIEIIARHLPETMTATIYAAHAEHLAQLRAIAATRGNLRVRTLSATPRLVTRQLAMRSLLRDFRRELPDRVLINTNASALLCAMAAGREPRLAERSALYVRDFLWHDIDYIFLRLGSGQLLVPNAVVAERAGYLFPFHIGPNGRTATVVPDMVEVPRQPAATADGTFLHLATVNRFKGHADLMMAAHRLVSGGSDIRIRSVGAGSVAPLHRQLLALHRDLGLAAAFEFNSYVSDPTPMLDACRAVVVPSVSHSGGPETFGRAVIEAWAHRKPVIAYATGAPARIIAHDQDGLLVPEGDIDALAAAMERLSNDEALCARLGAAGYRKVLERYEARAVTQQLLATLGLSA